MPNLLPIYVNIAEFRADLYIFYGDKIDSLAVIVADSELVLGVKSDPIHESSLLF